MMTGRTIATAVIFAMWAIQMMPAQTSTLVFPGAGGKLEYALYANTGQSNTVNRVSDFSYAGYRGGGVRIPNVTVVETVSPVAGDARAVIQAAIDRVSVLPLNGDGWRGAVLLKSGRYEVNGSLFIKAGGVVLRGEGQNTADKGGTEIVATAAFQHDFIQLKGNEISAEPASEFILDTKLYPPVHTWQELNVLQGVAEEWEGNQTISFHLTADVNQFVNYSSREDSAANRPSLLITTVSSVPGIDTMIILSPTEDTYVRGGTFATTNFGADSSIAVKNAGANNNVTREAYLKFDLSGVNEIPKAAILRLLARKDLAGDPAAIKTVTLAVSSITKDDWNEMTMTYATRPAAGGSVGAIRISTPYVPTGATSFEVDSVNGLAIGDTIKVTRTPNTAWITALDMAQYGWTASEYRISYQRIITGISGKSITIDIPLVQSLETQYGGGEISRFAVQGRLQNSGVENMLISSYFASDTDESHGWSAVTLSETAHCWVRKVTARYFGYSCVGLYWAYNTTVEDCAQLDPKSITTGSRKYSFYIDKGSFNLFQRCYTRGGRHDFVTGSRVAGPNVFVDGYATQTYADIGPHHRYATGVLFDNIAGGETRVQNRKDMGSGHGWAGAQTMFWNSVSNVSEFKVESPIGAMNWGIGCLGTLQSGAGFWESWGTNVSPRSLYYQQLKDRLGAAAVENVIVPAQRQLPIWSILSTWAGIGDLSALTGVSAASDMLPLQYGLSQNFPNPFNPTTNFQFSVPNLQFVKLSVFDLLGREVATPVNGDLSAGIHQVAWNASAYPSGVYIVNLKAGTFTASRTMVLLK